MHVRNFWVEIEIDGKVKRIATGPRGVTGGMRVRLLSREQGKISPVEVTIECKARGETLACSVYDGDRQVLHKETVR